ncbi:MAG: hypothetical protein Q8L10_05540 [Candidatus Moranbacteria bacterium]|nr:hypothetical protein [Candidatus Moranbacteria bacterium]
MPTKKFKASILVVTMMIMGIILVSALSISLVSIQERKASMGANKSNQAYQIADTGIEMVMDDIINGDNDRVSDLTGCRPADGLIHNDATGYTVELKDADENKIACNTNTDLSEVIHIKSVGTASGQAQRSIEAAVAAGGGCDWVDIDTGGTQQTEYVSYPSGNHSPEDMCKKAGYEHYSGACKTFVPTSYSCADPKKEANIQGSLQSNDHDGGWGLTCAYGDPCYFMNADPDESQILCCK